MSSEKVATDVVVVGAGLSGLTAALRLTQMGARVAVIEAKNRVGGRVDGIELEGGFTLELGARSVGAKQRKLLELAEELGVATMEQYARGRAVWSFSGKRTEYDPNEGLPLSDEGARELAAVWEALDRLGESISPGAPWDAPDAVALDRQTVRTWLDQHMTDPEAQWICDTSILSVVGVPLHRVSLLQLVSVVASAGGSANHLPFDYRFVGGPVEIARRITKQLDEQVHLGHPARTIDWNDEAERVTVRAEHLEISARLAIVAMSPSDARAIEFRPSLPPYRKLLHDHHQTACAVVSQLIYSEPFWRELGLSGSSMSDLPGAPVTQDCSAPSGHPGVLFTIYLMVPDGLPWGTPRRLHEASEDFRRQAMVDAAVALFGPQAARPIDYIEKSWTTEPYTVGCQPAMPPGLYTEVGSSFVDPVGPLYWSSTEHATEWQGYMAGAVDSGERVAREVQARLSQAERPHRTLSSTA